jgi:hypothetical protein
MIIKFILVQCVKLVVMSLEYLSEQKSKFGDTITRANLLEIIGNQYRPQSVGDVAIYVLTFFSTTHVFETMVDNHPWIYRGVRWDLVVFWILYNLISVFTRLLDRLYTVQNSADLVDVLKQLRSDKTTGVQKHYDHNREILMEFVRSTDVWDLVTYNDSEDTPTYTLSSRILDRFTQPSIGCELTLVLSEEGTFHIHSAHFRGITYPYDMIPEDVAYDIFRGITCCITMGSHAVDGHVSSAKVSSLSEKLLHPTNPIRQLVLPTELEVHGGVARATVSLFAKNGIFQTAFDLDYTSMEGLVQEWFTKSTYVTHKLHWIRVMRSNPLKFGPYGQWVRCTHRMVSRCVHQLHKDTKSIFTDPQLLDWLHQMVGERVTEDGGGINLHMLADVLCYVIILQVRHNTWSNTTYTNLVTSMMLRNPHQATYRSFILRYFTNIGTNIRWVKFIDLLPYDLPGCGDIVKEYHNDLMKMESSDSTPENLRPSEVEASHAI